MAEKRPKLRFPAEIRAQGVRLVREQRAKYRSDSAAYKSIASKLGCSHHTLHKWCIQAERDADKARIGELEREVEELRTANDILKKASAYFAQAEFDHQKRKSMPNPGIAETPSDAGKFTGCNEKALQIKEENTARSGLRDALRVFSGRDDNDDRHSRRGLVHN